MGVFTEIWCVGAGKHLEYAGQTQAEMNWLHFLWQILIVLKLWQNSCWIKLESDFLPKIYNQLIQTLYNPPSVFWVCLLKNLRRESTRRRPNQRNQPTPFYVEEQPLDSELPPDGEAPPLILWVTTQICDHRWQQSVPFWAFKDSFVVFSVEGNRFQDSETSSSPAAPPLTDQLHHTLTHRHTLRWKIIG